MTEQIDISGISKAALIKALYDHSKALGLGFLHDTPGAELSRDAAEALVNGERGAGSSSVIGKAVLSFDYVAGRVIKCDISGDTLDPWGYDRDLGQGACARAVEYARELEKRTKGRNRWLDELRASLPTKDEEGDTDKPA